MEVWGEVNNPGGSVLAQSVAQDPVECWAAGRKSFSVPVVCNSLMIGSSPVEVGDAANTLNNSNNLLEPFCPQPLSAVLNLGFIVMLIQGIHLDFFFKFIY